VAARKDTKESDFCIEDTKKFSYAAIIRSIVVFPRPFRPTKPYLLPKAMTTSAPCKSTLKNYKLRQAQCSQ
jgi:hypothetical protein